MPKTSNSEIELLRECMTKILDYLVDETNNQNEKTLLKNIKDRLN